MRRAIAVTMVVTGLSACGAAVAGAATNGRIVYQAGVGSRAAQVFTILPDGSGNTQVTHIPTGDPRKDPGAENPVWSPDGQTIAFDAFSQTPGTKIGLFTISLAGTGLAELPLNFARFTGDPAYSPDGSQISFDTDNPFADPHAHGIGIASVNGTNPHQLTVASRSDTGAFDTESQWSPDGQTIAFTRVKNDKKAAIFTVRVDGTQLTKLTDYKLDAASPDWSPDGQTIAFNSYWDTPHGNVSRVMTMRADGSHQKAITKDHFGKSGQLFCFRPSWSPDGTRIVFVRFKVKGDSGVDALYTMNPDGTYLQRVTTAKHVFPLNPDWGTAP